MKQLRGEEFTIENFVDGVIEVVHQVDCPVKAIRIQELLDMYYSKTINIDTFYFNFTMLMLGR